MQKEIKVLVMSNEEKIFLITQKDSDNTCGVFRSSLVNEGTDIIVHISQHQEDCWE